VRLNPAHEVRDEDEDEGDNGQCDANRQHFYGSIAVFPVTDHAEHARSKAENDQPEQDPNNDFNNEHGNFDVYEPAKCTGSKVVVDMILAGRQFRASWWAVAATVAGMSLFIALGMWQLERANFKDAIESKFQLRLSEPYKALQALEDQDIEYRKLRLEGRYDNTRNLLVDNKLHRGRAGYYVLTPLLLKDSDQVLLVNRGWTAWGESRYNLQPIATPDSAEGIAGIAYFPSESAFQMGGGAVPGRWTQSAPYQLIPHIDIDALQAPFEGRLLPWVLWLAPEQPGHYVRDWKPVWMRPEKSRAYATQWFAFSLVALVLFVIMNLRKIE
jgi:surfeit locus 1 family protein